MKVWITDRRQFGIAVGLGLFSSKSLWSQDGLLSTAEPSFVEWQELANQGHTFEHWTPEEDGEWKWFRLERYIDGTWRSVGMSLPVNQKTGETYQPAEGYVGLDQIPPYVLKGELPRLPQGITSRMEPSQFDPQLASLHLPDPEIQNRDGKPPSTWLRSLKVEELRMWLDTIDAPEATVSGMTFWVHLCRDHLFDPRRIEGLTEREFLLLHSAAHFGY